jgi:hypothetical protein
MPPGKPLHRRAWACPLAAIALVGALLPAPALAKRALRPSAGDLSSRLAALARPAVRSLPPVRQARALSVAADGPGSLLREGNRVLAEVRFDRGAAAGAADLRAAGARIVDVSTRYQTITVAARPADLRQLAQIPHVAAVTEVLAPLTAAASVCPAGAVVSEGDVQLRAAEARTAFGVDGAGVTVGILSDSFDRNDFADTHAAEDAEAGDLPGAANTCAGQATPVDTALDDYEPGPEEPAPEDEGRAMAQIVHDLAPGAALSFATAFTGLTAFAGNVEALAAVGANVIVDDVSYPTEPFFQEGPVGVAVSKVTADGVAYFSSAGNNNLIAGGKDIASWEAPAFRDAGGCPAGLPVYAKHCMDFDPGGPIDSTFAVKVSPGATLRLDLQWSQPWHGVTTDLDGYLLNAANNLLAVSENANAKSTEVPFEFLPWTNTTGSAQMVRVAINRCDAVCGGASGGDTGTPRLKFALLQNGGGVTEAEYPESSGGDTVGPTIFGHNGAEDAVSVGAVPIPPLFNDAPETYSSRGPVTHYFAPVIGTTPAEALITPAVLAKPDIVATDGGANTFFGSCMSHTWRFFGTSAAAPHAAAVAALERQAEPLATVEQVKGAQLETAGPVGAFPQPGPAIGAGLLDAGAAIAKLKSEPFSEPPGPLPPAPQNCDLPEPEVPPTEGVKEEIKPTNPPPPEPPPPPPNPRPRTLFLLRPPKVIRTAQSRATAVFRFGANEAGVTFLCRVDGEPFRLCPRRFARRYPVGPHVVRAVARDTAGSADLTPAVYRFRVKHVD